MSYVTPIKTAFLLFPLVALLISFPFAIVEYHKFGSVHFFKTFIIYLFVLYLLVAYFLVILPLPNIGEVAKLTTPKVQLVPFKFIADFIRNTSLNISDYKTIIPALKESYFYVPLFNIFLTIPFGMFLKYYNVNYKKITLYTFLLSLFFEITQLTGLYFIYPRGYRLFDIDDLMLNTLGGLIGSIIIMPVFNVIPSIEEVNDEALKKGREVSGFRRTTAFILDLFIVSFVTILISVIFDSDKMLFIILISYYLVIPCFLDFSTIGEKILNLQVRTYNNEKKFLNYFIRKILFILIYFIIPIFILILNFNTFIKILVIICLIIFYLVVFIKYIFTKKLMFYERVSKTKLVSTIC